ncbi:MAG TPA: OmpH family outer membrane protein [Candidatus Babeliales bacterium]|jgi:Skp family chaperone for outer membrane proteins|nr:OmpH family outer membrane protein [Candidatus Babeliales bacterium]
MKNRMITTTAFCVVLFSTVNAEDKNQSVLSTANFIGDSNVMIEAAIGFVDSFAIMGDCQEGQKARKEIESKRDLASNEIQEESKKFEKAKSDYVSKSTTMTDSAREKAEKQLIKMERDIKNLVAEKEEEIKADMQVATETLAQGLDAGVAKLAKNENLDVIFDKMTGRAMYVSEKFDFTDKAIKEVNKNYEIKLAHNKQAESSIKVADNKTAAAKPAKVGA